jgi:hypothetical protein
MMTACVLAGAGAAAINEFYFYPAGQPPAGLPAPSGTSTNISLPSWHDAQVHSAYPATPFGLDESALASDAGAVLVACTGMYDYLNGPVLNADIHLYTYGAAVALPWLSVGVARVNAAWQEDGVTWATRPDVGVPGYLNGAGDQLDSPLIIDVQAVIEAERQDVPDNRHGLALLDLAGSSPLWFTKESGVAAYRPYVHVFVPEPAAALGLVMFVILRAALRRIIVAGDHS